MWANDGIPRAMPAVATWRAVVLPGDDVGKIAERFTGDARRYPELIAANMLSKRLAAHDPERRRFRTFAELNHGERLLVPASWAKSRSSGAVGANEDEWVVTLSSYLAKQLEALFPGVQLPADVSWGYVAEVVLGWWPYLYDRFPTLPPILPTGAAPTLTPEQRDYVQKMVASAAQFVLATRAAGSVPQIAQSIPWADVPWRYVPWAAIAAQFPTDQAQFWAFMQKVPKPPLYSGAQVAPRQAVSQGVLAAGELQFSPVAIPGGGMFINKGAPDFANVDWTSAPYSEIAWSEVPWGSFAWEVFKDPELRACATANPGRLREIWSCSDCFEGKGVDFFKKALCDLQVDPCYCRNIETPPKLPPDQTQPGTGTGTTPSPVPNWNCTPWPQCLAEPGNWPANVPQPCTPFPACIPQWAKDHNIPLPPSAEQPKEEEKDNTVWWIVGGTVVAVAVVAAVAIAAK